MRGVPFELAVGVEGFSSPAGLRRGRFDLAQPGADVNRLAVIGAVVFVQSLHGFVLADKVSSG